MKNQKVLAVSTVFILLILISVSFADPVKPDMAYKAAETYLSQQLTGGLRKPALSAAISKVGEITDTDDKTLAYIVELENGGFVILSGDTDIEPVLGYSTGGEFPYTESHDNILLHLIKADMKNRLRSIPVINVKDRSHVLSNNALWEQFVSGSQFLKIADDEVTVWGPLLTTHWNQQDHYDDFCPIDPETGERSVVGCVAPASAQILNYWKYPKAAGIW